MIVKYHADTTHFFLPEMVVYPFSQPMSLAVDALQVVVKMPCSPTAQDSFPDVLCRTCTGCLQTYPPRTKLNYALGY